MIEFITILLFILIWVAMFQQWDNKAITKPKFEQELPSDLASVCRECHQAIHNHYGYNYKTKFNLLKGKPNEQKWN